MAGPAAREPVVLVPMRAADVAAIHRWPPYPSWAKDLDYALREGGWLDQFPESPRTRRLSAWRAEELVGFSILADIAEGDAEFYIAVHPDRIGSGIGRAITRETLTVGFREFGLDRIHLKVRDWHERGIALYQSEGFRITGTCITDVQDRPIRFVTMEIRKPSEVTRR